MCVRALCVCKPYVRACHEHSLHVVHHLEQIYLIYPCDCAVPPKFRVIHVSACWEPPHIILHYSDSALRLMPLHI